MTAGANTLTPSAERRLYAENYPAWLEYAAPRLALRLADARDDQVGLMWSLLTRQAQVAVWQKLDAAQRDRVRAHRGDDLDPAGVE